MASNFGNHETVKLLLERNAEVDAKTDTQLTPLDLAKDNGDPETIRLLNRETFITQNHPVDSS